MAGVTIIVKDDAVKAVLERMRAAGADMLPFFKQVGTYVQASVVRNFEEGGRPKWTPLKAATIKRKRGKTSILVDKGILKGVTMQAGADFAKVGVQPAAKAFAAIHQFGGTINHPGGTAYFPKKDGEIVYVSNAKARPSMPRTKPHSITIPARPYLVLQDEDVREILRLAEKHIRDAVA